MQILCWVHFLDRSLALLSNIWWMISSSSPEFSLSSSVEGVPGVVESKGSSRSSSSSGTPRRGSRVRKPSSHSFLKGAPAQRAAIPKGRKGSAGGRATWREMMEQQGALEDSHREMEVSGPLNGLEPSAMPSGSGLSCTSRPDMYQDNRQVHHHQTVQNFDDERQAHHHQTVQQYVAAPAVDPAVMASAAEAVTGARTEAAQAVLEARTQVMETHAQFQAQIGQLKGELNARDAALHLAGERERLLNVRLEESLREIETLKANMVHQSASQNATGVLESQIEVRIKLVEEGLANMRNMFSSLVAPRLDSNERKWKKLGWSVFTRWSNSKWNHRKPGEVSRLARRGANDQTRFLVGKPWRSGWIPICWGYPESCQSPRGGKLWFIWKWTSWSSHTTPQRHWKVISRGWGFWRVCFKIKRSSPLSSSQSSYWCWLFPPMEEFTQGFDHDLWQVHRWFLNGMGHASVGGQDRAREGRPSSLFRSFS